MCRRFHFYLSVRERIKNCDTQNKYLMSVDFTMETFHDTPQRVMALFLHKSATVGQCRLKQK